MDSINKWFNFVININNICNFKCKYCINNISTILPHYNYSISLDIIKLIVYCINNYLYEYNITIELLGGEPLLHKNLNNIIIELLQIKKLNIIHIFTNNTLPLNKININNKIVYNISYHYEELNRSIDLYNQFLANINYLNNNNIKYLLSILSKNYEDKYAIEIYNKFKKIINNQCQIELQYLINTPTYHNDNVVQYKNIFYNRIVYPKRSICIFNDNKLYKMDYTCKMINQNTLYILYNLKNWQKIRKNADVSFYCNQKICECYSCKE